MYPTLSSYFPRRCLCLVCRCKHMWQQNCHEFMCGLQLVSRSVQNRSNHLHVFDNLAGKKKQPRVWPEYWPVDPMAVYNNGWKNGWNDASYNAAVQPYNDARVGVDSGTKGLCATLQIRVSNSHACNVNQRIVYANNLVDACICRYLCPLKTGSSASACLDRELLLPMLLQVALKTGLLSQPGCMLVIQAHQGTF